MRPPAVAPSLASRLVLLALLPVAVFAVLAGVLVWLIGSVAGTAQRVADTDQVLGEIARLESRTLGHLVSVRGYLVTGSGSSLPSITSDADVARSLTSLRTLTRDNPGQQQRIASFEETWRQWRDVAVAEIATRKAGGDVAQLLRDRAEPLEHAMRTAAGEMRGVEEQLRVARVAEVRKARRQTLVGTTVAGLLLGVLLGTLNVRALRRVAAEYESAHSALDADIEKLRDTAR
jgi:methyl-accepting chemotaxis protein